MKPVCLFLLIIGMILPVYAQTGLPEHRFVSGNWIVDGQRLYQKDVRAPLAKANIHAPQSGPMIYEFNVRYETGVEDGHGGFGLHVFADKAYDGPSWGSGKSYLLWLNYDETPVSGSGIPSGLSAQVYRSLGNSYMTLEESVDLNDYLSLVGDDPSIQVPVKLWVNGETGEIRVYDPTDETLSSYYYFFVNSRDIPLQGAWTALRTNGISLSFGLGL
ncbi:MAG: hypothetical protein LBU28_05135 [Spirochaetaceae bacterium]|jgi:hypothetical protein|nr:hypothetical protein [Spirochaetaceae bacterium]